MSAFICNPEHIAALAAFACEGQNESVIYEWKQHGNPDTVKHVARELMRENIRSVSCRYADQSIDESAQSGFFTDMTNGDLIEASAVQAEHYFFNKPFLSNIDILKMVSCYNYQSCESGDWKDTLAKRQIDWIVNKVHRKLAGYEDATGEYSDDSSIWNLPPEQQPEQPVLLSSLFARS